MVQRRINAGILEIDIHKMTSYQAKISIDSLLKKLDKSIYRIRIIHGYHGGTVLKEMLQEEYKNHPKVLRMEGGWNEGITELVIREL